MSKRYIIGNLLLFISILIVISVIWSKRTFSVKTFNQIIFHLKVPMEGADNGIFLDYFLWCLPITVAIWGVVNLFIYKIPVLKTYILKLGILAIIASLIYTLCVYKIPTYLYNMFHETNLYEEYYVDPKTADISFNKGKRNIIHIYLESLENTYANGLETNYIPELSNLAKKNINFSHDDKMGGSQTIDGTQWTIASQVSQNMGIPLKISYKNKKFNYDTKFLPGGYAIGEILADNGYVNEFMCGSDANFGGTSNFYKQHGNYIIRDYNSFKTNGEIPEDYFVFWGIEDAKLFEFAKNDLTKLANGNQPFNFELTTIDTHTPDGYVCEKCEKKHKNQYANVIECQSRQVNDFINWCKQQPWYENTTIVVTGDHNSMSEKFFTGVDSSYVRTPYNCIINSVIEANNNQNRLFTTLDMYPTILASMGANIKGDRLGLGTNLYSNKKTVIEEIGYDKLNKSVQEKSDFYDEKILKLK